MSVTIIIGTFGDVRQWAPLADRARASAEAQTVRADEIVWTHGPTLASARNQAASSAKSEWLIFLDADDELDRHYIEEMLNAERKDTEAAAKASSVEVPDVYQPSTLGVYPDGTTDDEPVLIPEKDLLIGNYLVIGSMVRASLFAFVGGFDEYPILEDWALWLKCRGVGAVFGKARKAIYRVHVNPDSRNQSQLHGQWYAEIRRRFDS